MKFLLGILCVFWGVPVLAQMQACPVNINFNQGTLSNWTAETGIVLSGSSNLDTNSRVGESIYPNWQASSISEYQLPSMNGVKVITSSSTDYYGGFPTVPTINGYQYFYSVLLGSTAISKSNGNQGGYFRNITYSINVPPGPTSVPYTMTYAYAMVLENGTHNSDQQPQAKATLSVNGTIITCASPSYLLPTLNNAQGGGTGATLDSAAAIAQGFTPSRYPSVNANPNSPTGGHLYDVWWKGWTEVTFDLSAYRGQQVKLTFEADNCTPGGHFAYAYFAFRNTCAGLQISGDSIACISTPITYSVPSLAGATYDWTIPGDWTINSGSGTNIIQVTPGNDAGQIIAHEVNGCADLRDTIDVKTVLPTLPATLGSPNEVCTGTNSTTLNLSGGRGGVVSWLSSYNNGVSWGPLADTNRSYTASDLTRTTTYAALIQNGQSCAVDTTNSITVTVDPKSVGGTVTPPYYEVCMGQNKGAILTDTGATGHATAWQSSSDGGTTWADLVPMDTSLVYGIQNVTGDIEYRVIVQSGVCPADISSIAQVKLLNAYFPVANIAPADTTICYGGSATLTASVSTGTSYQWTHISPLSGSAGGAIPYTTYDISNTATPLDTSLYILTILNAGCPNALVDTFVVNVYPRIVVNAGNDTAVVVGQPLQFNAKSNDPGDTFAWTPAYGLSATNIPNPIGQYTGETTEVDYTVTATAANGCTGTDGIVVKIFRTPPDIFVPTGFTPGLNIDNIFRPILVGISSLDFFRVYNRYGQLVYSTSSTEEGWDGTVNGKPQPTAAYVWMVQGRSYMGQTIFKKGTVVLMR
ncbi:MAG TPA: gliding motility-associated C-terminal domain-containing protein [Dinghuibacter sp.]|jgi:gliding motility-associated-like protein|uniref:T9SS type B sorting domain-containing protein n=1 Tax=Dinghuibacter sp. TaxID=2024697 RepID=UPI002C111460|nr:gliding motility-associated C-terminal domain-containing protein [Dinghuibacter sp.]HTJ11655.1 gliding motility-associated C-terminal domain-containing protein [Dinghuibacter sp.]